MVFLTPWDSWPVTGEAFEPDAIDVLIAARRGDPFMVYALAYATASLPFVSFCTRPRSRGPWRKGTPRRLTRAETEAVIAEQEAVVQVVIAQYERREGPLWKTLFERYRKQGMRQN